MTLKISLLSFVGLLLGFINQLVIANIFGAGIDRDIFFSSFSIANYIFLIFNGSFVVIFLSYYIKICETRGSRAGSSFLLQIFSFLTVFLLIIVSFCILSDFEFLHSFFPKYTGLQFLLLKKILSFQLISVIFQILGTLMSILFQIKERYYLFSFFTLLSAIVNVICVYILSHHLGILALPVASICSYVVSTLFLCANYRKLKLEFNQISLLYNASEFFGYLRVCLPLFFSGIVFRFNTVFERFLASKLPEGSVSYLGYSSQILAMMATLVTTGLAALIVPEMARNWSNNNKTQMENDLSNSVSIILILLCFVAIIMLTSGDLFIAILFQRGKFDHKATEGVATAFNYLIGALIFQSLGNIVVKVLYLTEQSWAASFIGVLEMATYICLSIWLVKIIGFRGPALATSISSGLNIVLTLLYIKKSGINLLKKKTLIFLCKILISCSFTYLCITALNSVIGMLPALLKGVIILTISFGLYVLLLYILKVTEAIVLINRISIYLKKDYARNKK